MTQEELKLVFDALKQCNVYAFAGGLGKRATAHRDALAILEKALAQPEPEHVATVIEELEHDGQGWCSKVRWLYNPVPVGETLSWEQPK